MAAAAAGVKTLFCRGFGRGFFYLYRLFRFGVRTVKTATHDPIRYSKNAFISCSPREKTGHATCHHCRYISTMYPPLQTRKRGDK
jgi:hypothetical protein